MEDIKPNWEILEDINFDVEGYILVPVDLSKKGTYILGGSPESPACMFPTLDDAKDAIAELMRRGMPIGSVAPIKAKLAVKKKLEVLEETVAPSLIIL